MDYVALFTAPCYAGTHTRVTDLICTWSKMAKNVLSTQITLTKYAHIYKAPIFFQKVKKNVY